jgi:hypothetical protein
MNIQRSTLLSSAAAILLAPVALGQPATVYWLDAESALVHEPCLGPCDCVSPPLVGTLGGAFQLRLDAVGHVFNFYSIPRARLTGDILGQDYRLNGSGEYREAAAVGVIHSISLSLSITDELSGDFESNVDAFVGRMFPFIDIDAETAVLGCSRYTVRIRASVGCAADFNLDGRRDPDDLSDFITCFFLDVQMPGSCEEADFNGDGGRDPDDLADFITAFFTC